MQITSARANPFLEVKAKAAAAEFPSGGGKLRTATATIGGNAEVSYPAAATVYAITLASTAASDGVTIALETGVASVDAGSPTVTGDEVDFTGETLPEMTAVHAIRITAGDNGTGVAEVAVTLSAQATQLYVHSGQSVLLAFAVAGADVTSGEIGVVFPATGMDLTVEVIAS
jgi:hypothetical protein